MAKCWPEREGFSKGPWHKWAISCQNAQYPQEGLEKEMHANQKADFSLPSLNNV